MAVSLKHPSIISLNSDHPNHICFKHPNLKVKNYAQIFSKYTQFSLKKTYRKALLNSTSSFTADPNSYLIQLCKQEELGRAIKFLNSVGKELLNDIEEETFVSLVRLCKFKGASKEGSLIYSLVLNVISNLSLRLGNELLHLFVRLGNLSDAWYVFGKMTNRNLLSWNILIGGYAKSGFLDEAIELYGRMLCVGGITIKPDVYTFPCVLRACGGLKNWEWGREIHAHVLRFGFEDDVDVINSLITMYVKCGDLSSARVAFDGMSKRDTITWNAMISGYFENGECFEGLRVFFAMREHCFHPNFITMTSVISACGDEKLGREVHGYIAKTEYAAEDSVGSALIQMYSRFRMLCEADKVFSRIECKDLLSWTSMISGYNNNGLPDKAVETYKMMELEGVVPDEFTIASVLSACACLGSLDIGIKLHQLAKRTGFIRHLLVATALIDLYSKCNYIDKALEIFHQIPNKDIVSWTSVILGLRINNRSFMALIYFRQMIIDLTPNEVTFIVVLSACARIGAVMCGREIHANVLKKGLGFDSYLPNALLHMYAECGRMERASNQFNAQKQDVVSWNVLLAGHARRANGVLAIELFHKMIESQIRPGDITFIALLCACSRSGMVREGLQYFNAMEAEYSVAPNVKHYACVVDLLGRAGKLDDAYEVIEKMPVKPDAAIWGVLLNACRIHRRVELGELAARHIFAIESQNVQYYILLCHLYSGCGKWDEVDKLRKTMREMGLIVDPGCSWIEVKGVVNAFLTGDCFHPQIREITALLEKFYEKMEAEEDDIDPGRRSEEVESSEAYLFCGHSERLAVGFGLINSSPGMPIQVTKNLYMCKSCHSMMKFISKVVRRGISVRDTECFHHFKDGTCSCRDEGYRELS